MTMDILIIDSDSSTIEIFESLIAHQSLSFRLEETGASGLLAAEKEVPSLIILSVELKDMNGFMVCKKLRESKKLKNIPIIIVSSDVGEKGFKQHMKLKTRADVYVQKPFVPSEIQSNIAKLLDLDLDVNHTGTDSELDLDHLLEDDGLIDVDFESELNEGLDSSEQLAFIQELKSKIDDQQHQLEYYKKELDASKMYFSQMQNQQGGDSVELKNKEQECERLSFELKELTEKRDESQELIQELTSENRATQKNLMEAEEAINNLTLKVEEEREKASQFEINSNKLSEQLKSLGETSQNKSNEEEVLVKRSLDLEADLYKTQEILDEMNVKIDEKENASKTRELAFHEEIKELETALENARHTNHQLEELLLDRETDLQEIQESLQGSEKQKGETDSKVQELEKENERMKREHAEILSTMNEDFQELLVNTKEETEKDMRVQLDEIQESAEKRIEGLNLQLTEVDQENEELKNRIETVLNEKRKKEEDWHQEMSSLEEKYRLEKTASENDTQARETEINDLKTKHDELQRLTEEQVLELKEASDEKDDLLEQLKKLKEGETILIRKLDEEISSLESTHAERLKDWEQKLHDATALQEELTEQIDLLKQELEEKNQALETDKKEAQLNLQMLQVEMEKVEKQNTETIAEQSNQVESLKAEIDSLTGSLEAKIVELGSLEARVDQLNLGHKTLKDRLSHTQEILEEGLKQLMGESETLDFEE